MKEKKPTEDEHFIPQTYLKSFAFDGKRIYMYDMAEKIPQSKPVPVKSVCYIKDLYELKNKGNYISRNYYEEWFSKIESVFAVYKKTLIDKVRLGEKSDYKLIGILSEKETAFWYYYIAMQLCRHPKTLFAAAELAKKQFAHQSVSEDLINNMATIMCLPGADILPSDGKALFTAVLECLGKLHIIVLYNPSGRFITADFPVYTHLLSESIDKVDEVIFPLTPSVALYLTAKSPLANESDFSNLLSPIDCKRQSEIIQSIAYVSERFIYSKNELSKDELNTIQKAHNDKIKDKRI